MRLKVEELLYHFYESRYCILAHSIVIQNDIDGVVWFWKRANKLSNSIRGSIDVPECLKSKWIQYYATNGITHMNKPKTKKYITKH